jgi:hypothetical protein
MTTNPLTVGKFNDTVGPIDRELKRFLRGHDLHTESPSLHHRTPGEIRAA